MSNVIALGSRSQLAQNRSIIAAIIRASSIFEGVFSSRDMVGCEQRAGAVSGRRPTASLKTGSLRSASQSSPSS